jgi:hypothetical protein
MKTGGRGEGESKTVLRGVRKAVPPGHRRGAPRALRRRRCLNRRIRCSLCLLTTRADAIARGQNVGGEGRGGGVTAGTDTDDATGVRETTMDFACADSCGGGGGVLGAPRGGALGAPLYGLPLEQCCSSPRLFHHFSLRLKQVSAAHVGFMAKEMVIG